MLDHSDTTLRLGFVTDIHHDRLDGGTMDDNGSNRPERPSPQPKECPVCHHLRAAGISACPSCGHVAERVSTVETIRGELVDLSAHRSKVSAGGKLEFFMQLRGYAQANGKSEKWVLATYRAKFQEWPYRKHVPAMRPSPEVVSFIRSRQIAWAKSKARA